MEKILDIIYKIAGPHLINALIKIASAVESVSKYLQIRTEAKAENERIKRAEQAEKNLDDACDSGNLRDLINATKKIGNEKLK